MMLKIQQIAVLAMMLVGLVPAAIDAFTVGAMPRSSLAASKPQEAKVVPRIHQHQQQQFSTATMTSSSSLHLQGPVSDLETIALVAGQENYGLAVVCVFEALWSFFQAPSFDHAKVLVPAGIAALILVVVSGPMVTSGDFATVGTGLWIATGVSLGLGASYVARLVAPFSPSAKEIAAFGLLVAVAGFFSFSQNLVVDGFVTLPSLPSLPSISLPSIDL